MANPLKYEKYRYTVYANRAGQGIPEKALRAEYSRLRTIANKRIAALGRSEFAGTRAYLEHAEGFAPLAILDSRELLYELQKVAQFLSSPRSSVTGLRKERKETLETLRARGVTSITKQNYAEFVEFMEAARAIFAGRIPDSDRVVEIYDALKSANVSDPVQAIQQDFEYWYNNVYNIPQRTQKNTAPISAAELRQLMEE